MKIRILLLFIGLLEFQVNGQWVNLVSNYSFEKNDLNTIDIQNYNNNFISHALGYLQNKKYDTINNKNVNHIYPKSEDKEDSSQSLENRIISNGVFIRLSGYPFYYSLGYEYEIRKNKNAFGVDVGTAVNVFDNHPSGYRYLNLYLGFSPFYEYGKRWGFRVGLQTGATINPIGFSDKLYYTAPADRPYTAKIWEMLNIGTFYRTKNEKWKFMLSVYSGYVALLRKEIDSPTVPTIFEGFQTKNRWDYGFIPIPFPGITVMYNFKLTTK